MVVKQQLLVAHFSASLIQAGNHAITNIQSGMYNCKVGQRSLDFEQLFFLSSDSITLVCNNSFKQDCIENKYGH